MPKSACTYIHLNPVSRTLLFELTDATHNRMIDSKIILILYLFSCACDDELCGSYFEAIT